MTIVGDYFDRAYSAKSDTRSQFQMMIKDSGKRLFWLHKFRGIDITSKDQRQRLIDTFVNVAYLYYDKTVLSFNY